MTRLPLLLVAMWTLAGCSAGQGGALFAVPSVGRDLPFRIDGVYRLDRYDIYCAPDLECVPAEKVIVFSQDGRLWIVSDTTDLRASIEGGWPKSMSGNYQVVSDSVTIRMLNPYRTGRYSSFVTSDALHVTGSDRFYLEFVDRSMSNQVYVDRRYYRLDTTMVAVP